jgi:hypothetical protein
MSERSFTQKSPAWSALAHHAKTLTPVPPELYRAMFEEHMGEEKAKQKESLGVCLEHREEWIEAAEFISPSENTDLSERIEDTLQKHADQSLKPAKPRFPFIAKLLARFKK